MPWLDLARIVLSWVLFAGALVGLALSLGAIIIFRKEAFGLFDGHLRTGLGFTLLCFGGGLVASHPRESIYLGVIGAACGLIGYLIAFFGRRRAREVNHFIRAMENAKANSPPQKEAQ